MSDLADLRCVPDAERRPMTRSESGTFVQACMAGLSGKDAPKSATELCAEFADAPLAMKIMVKRLSLGEDNLRFSPMTVLFLCSLCETPARVVLWAHFLVRRSYELKSSVVNVAVLADDFPMGFPTDDGMSRVWERQKRADAPGGNALDTAEPWQRVPAMEAA